VNRIIPESSSKANQLQLNKKITIIIRNVGDRRQNAGVAGVAGVQK
jgi:hypothetical protein